jgi:hypothetical protein
VRARFRKSHRERKRGLERRGDIPTYYKHNICIDVMFNISIDINKKKSEV